MSENVTENGTEQVVEHVARDAAADPSGSPDLDKDDPEASTVDSGGGPTCKEVPETTNG